MICLNDAMASPGCDWKAPIRSPNLLVQVSQSNVVLSTLQKVAVCPKRAGTLRIVGLNYGFVRFAL
jgi:hypothetical protein